MHSLTISEARRLIEKPLSKSESRIPEWFTPDLIPFLFPIEHRPSVVPIITPPRSPDEKPRTSSRRDEDEARRRAMHSLVTSWDTSAKKTAKQLMEILYRGGRPPTTPVKRLPGQLGIDDLGNINKFHSLITGDPLVDCGHILRSFQDPCPSLRMYMPAASVGGYTVTETVGPLAMLTQVIKRRETVKIWIKEKFEISHGRRRVRIIKREGRVLMFDRYMNLLFVPLGNAADCWQFIRGNVIALIQRRCSEATSSPSSFQSSSQCSSRSSGN